MEWYPGGNSFSRLLDHLEDIPFPNSSENFVKALKALKEVKDNCLGKVRKTGWKGSIRTFREAWHGTGLPWSLKSHILYDRYEEYFTCFENIADAGAAISSEQSGEMLHSRIQKVWDLTEEDQNPIEEFDGEGDSKEYNEERIELHNCLTDPEYSDQSDSD